MFDPAFEGSCVQKHLEIDEHEAATIRQIFKLFLEGDGTKGPMGVKDIASWLNCNGFRSRNGNPFYVSIVHAILTRTAYSGVYNYNAHDGRTRRARPESEWVAVSVPQIISTSDFSRVQELLCARRPNMTPPRITNSEVLLTGLARCESCGSPLMLSTSKRGRYRYYTCAATRLKGKTACKVPTSIPEAQLDQLVLGALADQLLTPERLVILLREAIRHRRSLAANDATQRTALRSSLKNAETKIERLLAAVAEGTIPDMALLRTKMNELNGQRDECARHLQILDTDLPELRQTLSKQQAATVATTLKRRLLDAPRALQRRYVRGLVSEIVVDREIAVISGPRAAIAAYASDPGRLGSVPSFVREWRTGQDENENWQVIISI